MDSEVPFFVSTAKIIDCLPPTFHFHFDWGFGLKFVMFLGNINFISERQNWIEKDCIVKEGKVMPGGLSGADWSWVGGVVLLPGQPGSGPRLLGSRTREESGHRLSGSGQDQPGELDAC